jgi:hypothetical protein
MYFSIKKLITWNTIKTVERKIAYYLSSESHSSPLVSEKSQKSKVPASPLSPV